MPRRRARGQHAERADPARRAEARAARAADEPRAAGRGDEDLAVGRVARVAEQPRDVRAEARLVERRATARRRAGDLDRGSRARADDGRCAGGHPRTVTHRGLDERVALDDAVAHDGVASRGRASSMDSSEISRPRRRRP